MANKAPPTPAREDYLKAIFQLGAGEREVGTAELAAALEVSKPSVSAMLRRLAGEGLVAYAPRRGARVTEEGRRHVMAVLRRHRLLETFLVEVLQLDWSEVHAEAEVLEHHLSDRLLDAIDRRLGHPREDPHGHPIPDASGELRVRDLLPLSELPTGTQATVRELRAERPEQLQRWKELGLVPGARCAMARRQQMEQVMHVVVEGATFATGREGVRGVFVEEDR